jgi:myo-inositol-1(or 4)-monophosphatase
MLLAVKLGATVMLANNPWDVAAGVILAREAGAVVLDTDGSEHTVDSAATIAVAPALREELAGLISEAQDRLAGGGDRADCI